LIAIKRSIGTNGSQTISSIHLTGETGFVIPVETGIQHLNYFPGFPPEFIPYLIRGENDNAGASNT
jgi:hypothetical protein